jgi:hypothetical protein
VLFIGGEKSLRTEKRRDARGIYPASPTAVVAQHSVDFVDDKDVRPWVLARRFRKSLQDAGFYGVAKVLAVKVWRMPSTKSS